MPNEAQTPAPAAAGTPPAGTGKTPAAVKPPETPAAVKPPEGKEGGQGEPQGRQARLAALVKKAEDKKASEKAAKDGKKPDEPGSKDAAGAGAEPVGAAGKGDDKKPPKTAPGYATQRIAELEAENVRLKGESRESFLAEVKKDARVLLRAMGGDGHELLLSLAESLEKEKDPEERVKFEVERQTADLRRRAEEGDKREAEAKANEQRQAFMNATKELFEKGYTEGEEKVADPSAWPLSAKLTKAGEIDAPAEAMAVVGAMVKNAREKAKKEGKPEPKYSDKQAATMLSAAFAAIEKREQTAKARRLAAYNDGQSEGSNEDKDPKSKEGIKARVRRTLTSRVGYGQTVGREEPKDQPKNRHDRRQERLSKLR